MTDKFIPVPDYPRYVINQSGVLIDTKTNKEKTWYIQKPIKRLGGRIRNMKRGYKIARVVDNQGNKRHIFQHRVLAILFIPCPGDPNDYIVNHKDGDGGNNDLSNLEWSTYSENMYHAYQTGLCGGLLAVLARDAKTGRVTEYMSVADCARAHNLHHATLLKRIRKNPGVIFEDVNTAFKFVDDLTEWSSGRLKSVRPVPVCALDVVNNKFYVAEDQEALAKVTGVTAACINANLNKGRLTPTGSLVFMWYTHSKEMLVPKFNSNQIELFKLPRAKSDIGGWLEINLITDERKVYLLKDLAKKYGLSGSHMTRILRRGISNCKQFKFEYISPHPIEISPLSK